MTRYQVSRTLKAVRKATALEVKVYIIHLDIIPLLPSNR